MEMNSSECVDLTLDQEPVIAIFTLHEAGLTVTLHPLELQWVAIGACQKSSQKLKQKAASKFMTFER
jgi:hypothetical protein